ncbi:MAG: hypothetical protein ACR2PL_01655, partial [Dehalococcoidia bacterium]
IGDVELEFVEYLLRRIIVGSHGTPHSPLELPVYLLSVCLMMQRSVKQVYEHLSMLIGHVIQLSVLQIQLKHPFRIFE